MFHTDINYYDNRYNGIRCSRGERRRRVSELNEYGRLVDRVWCSIDSTAFEQLLALYWHGDIWYFDSGAGRHITNENGHTSVGRCITSQMLFNMSRVESSRSEMYHIACLAESRRMKHEEAAAFWRRRQRGRARFKWLWLVAFALARSRGRADTPNARIIGGLYNSLGAYSDQRGLLFARALLLDSVRGWYVPNSP